MLLSSLQLQPEEFPKLNIFSKSKDQVLGWLKVRSVAKSLDLQIQSRERMIQIDNSYICIVPFKKRASGPRIPLLAPTIQKVCESLNSYCWEAIAKYLGIEDLCALAQCT